MYLCSESDVSMTSQTICFFHHSFPRKHSLWFPTLSSFIKFCRFASVVTFVCSFFDTSSATLFVSDYKTVKRTFPYRTCVPTTFPQLSHLRHAKKLLSTDLELERRGLGKLIVSMPQGHKRTIVPYCYSRLVHVVLCSIHHAHHALINFQFSHLHFRTSVQPPITITLWNHITSSD